MTPQVRSELQHLLSCLCDGTLSEVQHARLEQLLAADVECRRLYLEYLDLHAHLLVHPPANEASASPHSSKRQVLRYAAVAAATLAASLLIQVLWGQFRSPDDDQRAFPRRESIESKPLGYVATLTRASDCVWQDAADIWRAGSRLLPGDMHLRRGLARIRFDSGPDLVLEGPAEVRLESSSAATVLRGKVVFRADDVAAPFILRTPASNLLDLGTEYAVAVSAAGEEVHVFDGEVQRTPRTVSASAEPEHLTAGQARYYEGTPASPGRPTALDSARFIRELPEQAQPPADAAAGLLAYEGFEYLDPGDLRAGQANGGFGWAGPWRPGFARPLNDGDRNLLALNVHEGLARPGAAVRPLGGCFDYTGFAKYFRRLGTPVRLDADAVYYVSFLFRRHGPPTDPLNSVSLQFRTSEELEKELNKEGIDLTKRLNMGVDRCNDLFTHLERIGTRTPMPLSFGETYLLVAKIVASRSNPDQVFLRIYGPQEPIGHDEPGSWPVAGPPVQSDLVFEWLEIHINSKTRQTIDEIRLGSTWASVTAPWHVANAAR